MAKKDPEYTPPGLTLGEFYYLVFRHKWKILSTALVGLIAASVVYAVTPVVYRSWAMLLVRYVREVRELEPGSDNARVISPDDRGQNLINSEIEILTSPDLAEKTVRDLGLDKFEDKKRGESLSLHAAAIQILLHLSADVPRRSNVIKLSFDASSPELAQKILGKLVENYLQKHSEIHGSGSSSELLSQQTDQMRAALARTEEELRDLKKAAGIVSVQESRAFLAARLAELTTACQDAEVQLQAARAESAVMQAYPEPPPAGAAGGAGAAGAAGAPGAEAPAVAPGAEPGTTAARPSYATINELRARERELMATFREDSIPVQNIRRQIAQLEQALRMRELVAGGAARETLPEDIRAGVPATQVARMVAMEARVKALRQQIADVRIESEKIEDVESRINELDRKRTMQEANYLYFAQSLERTRMDDALNTGSVSNIKVAQSATYPVRPWRPNVNRNMAIAVGLCLVIGLAMAFGSEYYLDHTIKRPGDIEGFLGMPVLVSLPVSAAARRTGSGGRPRERIEVLTAEPGRGESAGLSQWDMHEALGPYVATLRDRVVKAMDPAAHRPHLIGVTGCAPGSGVSTLAAGLAVTLASSGDGRVLLVDAHVGPSADNRVFGTTPTSGALDIRVEGQSCTSVVQPNLYFLSTQPPRDAADPVNVLQGFADLVTHVSETPYDFVVFDMPPVSDTSLTPRVAGAMAHVILVIRAETIRREAALRASQLLARSGGKVLGAVLNMRKFYVPNWLYRSY